MARVPDVVSRRNCGLRHFGGAVPGVLSLGDVHRVPRMLEVGGGRAGRRGLGHRVADVVGDRTARAVVAAVADPPDQLRHRRHPRVVGHQRRLRHRIRRHVDDSGPARESALHDVLRRGPVQATDVQHHGHRSGHDSLLVQLHDY